MAESVEQLALPQAGRIIERLGGIRAASERLNVPVTAVQGWKQADIIPGDQRGPVLRAALAANIDLSDIVTGPPANGNATAFDAAIAEAAKGGGSGPVTVPEGNDFLLNRINAVESKAVRRSILLTGTMLCLVGALAVFLLWPELSSQDRRLTVLEQQQAALQKDMTQQKILLPQQIEQSLAQLKTTLNGAAAQVDAAAGINLEGRVGKLEQQVSALAAPAALQAMLVKIAGFQQTPEGQKILAAAVRALGAGNADQLPQVAQQDDAAKQVLGGVAPGDVKPASILLGVSQLRDALDRGGVPFADALGLLRKLLAGQDAALDTDMAQLAPAASRGIPTQTTVVAQFTPAFAASIVDASLRNTGGTVRDHALAGLNSIVEVHKDGTLVSGTGTQGAVDGAQAALQRGDLAAAAAALKPLAGPAAVIAMPWLEEAHDVLLAGEVAHRLTARAAVMVAGGGLQLTTMGGGVGNMTRDVQTLSPGITPAVPATQPAQ